MYSYMHLNYILRMITIQHYRKLSQ